MDWSWKSPGVKTPLTQAVKSLTITAEHEEDRAFLAAAMRRFNNATTADEAFACFFPSKAELVMAKREAAEKKRAARKEERRVAEEEAQWEGTDWRPYTGDHPQTGDVYPVLEGLVNVQRYDGKNFFDQYIKAYTFNDGRRAFDGPSYAAANAEYERRCTAVKEARACPTS